MKYNMEKFLKNLEKVNGIKNLKTIEKKERTASIIEYLSEDYVATNEIIDTFQMNDIICAEKILESYFEHGNVPLILKQMVDTQKSKNLIDNILTLQSDLSEDYF